MSGLHPTFHTHCLRMHTCTSVHLYTCTPVHLYTCTHAHLYICTCAALAGLYSVALCAMLFIRWFVPWYCTCCHGLAFKPTEIVDLQVKNVKEDVIGLLLPVGGHSGEGHDRLTAPLPSFIHTLVASSTPWPTCWLHPHPRGFIHALVASSTPWPGGYLHSGLGPPPPPPPPPPPSPVNCALAARSCR